MKLKRYVIHKLLKHLFNAVSSDDILWVDKSGKWHIGEDELTKEDVFFLTTEANTLKNTQLYSLLITRSKWLANNAIFNRSTTDEDLLFPKAMLKWTEEIEKTVNKLAG